MNLRFTLIVVLVFVALLALAWTLRDQAPQQLGPGAPTGTPEALYDLVSADIQEVAVAGADGDYALKRVAGGWEVDGQKANDQVDSLVTRLANPSVVMDLPSDRKPDDYGFATPSLTVTLKTAAGEERVLQVGDDTPVDANVYVRLKDGKRMVVLGRGDITQLKDWLTTPPLAPTPTPAEGGTPGTPAMSSVGEGAAGTTVPRESATPVRATETATVPPATPSATAKPATVAPTAVPTKGG